MKIVEYCRWCHLYHDVEDEKRCERRARRWWRRRDVAHERDLAEIEAAEERALTPVPNDDGTTVFESREESRRAGYDWDDVNDTQHDKAPR